MVKTNDGRALHVTLKRSGGDVACPTLRLDCRFIVDDRTGLDLAARARGEAAPARGVGGKIMVDASPHTALSLEAGPARSRPVVPADAHGAAVAIVDPGGGGKAFEVALALEGRTLIVAPALCAAHAAPALSDFEFLVRSAFGQKDEDRAVFGNDAVPVFRSAVEVAVVRNGADPSKASWAKLPATPLGQVAPGVRFHAGDRQAEVWVVSAGPAGRRLELRERSSHRVPESAPPASKRPAFECRVRTPEFESQRLAFKRARAGIYTAGHGKRATPTV